MSRHKAKAAEEARIDPLRVLITADQYHKTAGRLYRLTQDELEKSKSNDGYADLRFIIPHMMISSFAPELYFKCIYAIERNGATTVMHDYQWFYNRISPGTEVLMKGHWDRVSAEDPTMKIVGSSVPNLPAPNLEACIKESRLMFEKVRYYDEVDTPTWQLGILPHVLRATIGTLRPDYFPISTMRKVLKPPEWSAAFR